MNGIFSNIKNNFLKLFCFILLFSIILNQNSRVKKISFFKEFQNVRSNKPKFFDNYLKHFDNITRENQLKFKRVKIYEREAFQPYLKEKQDFTEDGIKLFRINKKFVISMDKIKKNDNYNIFYKYIKSDKDAMAMMILQETNLKEKSPFYYYLRNIPINSIDSTPILYDYSSISLYIDDDTHQKVLDQVNNLKVSYNHLRRLLFSMIGPLKDMAGSFSFGDYIWATHVVNYYSIKSESSNYFIPGAEYLNINGLMNVENPLVNCCLYYHVKDSGDYYELYANVQYEDVFEFYDRYPNVNKILLNPNYNNEELFIGFGINYIENNPFDYINLDMNKILNLNQKDITSNIRLSCIGNDLNNLDYFLQTAVKFEEEKNSKLYYQYLNKLTDFLSHKIFEIERIFEQYHEIEFQDEAVESYYFLKNKRVFLNSLVECLKLFNNHVEQFDYNNEYNMTEKEISRELNEYNIKEDL